jgi:MinD-like ATPase involved in chromosome partitioning or flagellar assembly
MNQLREPSPAELRRAIQEELAPERLVVRRDHAGALSLRILSGALEGVDDPFARVEEILKVHGLRLPDRTLTILKAPGDLEDKAEEELFFADEGRGTPSWGDGLLLEPCRPLPRDDRGFEAKVVAFWAVPGGVGCSTALVHVAAILGRRKRVLAIDLDLESPSLIAILAGGDGSEPRVRIEELVRAAAAGDRTDEDLQRLIRQALYRPGDRSCLFEVLGPVLADTPYVLNLQGPLAPAALYRGRRPALPRLVDQAIRATDAEVLLLDARSGYCDDSAMSVLDLADEVVLFASPAPSTFPSLAPAVEALERNRQALGRPKIVYIVAGMMPAGEIARARILETLQETLESAQQEVSEILETPDGDRPPEIVIIPVDYSCRIVENEGTLLHHASGGYREIAERICPALP